MGLYDRGYTQADSYGDYGNQTTAQRFANQPMVIRIIIITVAIFLIDNLLMSNAINEVLKLEARAIFNPLKIWKLITVGVTHAPLGRSIWHVVFNMYSLWLFGRAVEQKYGSREFLALYLALLTGSSICWCAFELIQGHGGATAVGASGAVSGVLVIFALNFPRQKFYIIPFPFPIQAWLLGIIMVGMDALGTLGVSANPMAGTARIAYTAHLGGALFGLLYFLSQIRLTGGANQSGYGSIAESWKFPKFPNLGKAKSKLKVFDPERSDADLDRRADAILEKMHRDGADSLTARERKILDEYSRRVRERQQR